MQLQHSASAATVLPGHLEASLTGSLLGFAASLQNVGVAAAINPLPVVAQPIKRPRLSTVLDILMSFFFLIRVNFLDLGLGCQAVG